MASISTNPAMSGEPFEPIPTIRTVFDAMQVMRKTCVRHRFKYFSIIQLPRALHDADASISDLATISSWPPELIAEYDRMGLAKNSPILEQLRKQITPLVFEVEEVNSKRPKDERDSANQLFMRFGLTRGVYFPVHDAQGLRYAVSFMGDREPMDAQEMSMLAVFSAMLIEQLSKIGTTDRTAKSVLNPREIEVLQWTAEGKTSGEIAQITGLSEHTVNHYATIATRKLGCSNRTQAVVYAMRLGLFS